ncbi:MAG: hypothetical protein ACKO2C_09225 [Actinomycetes bacterium]
MTATALRTPATRRATAPRLRVVGARRTARRELGLPSAARIGIAFVLVVCFVALSVHAFVQVGQVRLRDLTERTADAQAQYTEARLAYARAASPDHIAAEAKRLGLQAGPTPRYVSVPDPGPSTVRVPTSSTEGYQKVKPSLDVRP